MTKDEPEIRREKARSLAELEAAVAVIRLKAGDRAIAGCQAPRPWPSPTSEPRCGLRVCALRSMIGWSTTKVETWASN
jgi:hypothetical protein